MSMNNDGTLHFELSDITNTYTLDIYDHLPATKSINIAELSNEEEFK